MAAGKINMKQISEDLKSFLTKEMENDVKKITEKIIEKVDAKDTIGKIDRNAEAAETQAKQNQNNISYLTRESTALQEKLVEPAKKICELEGNTEEQVNRNSSNTLVIGGIKKKNQEKTE